MIDSELIKYLNPYYFHEETDIYFLKRRNVFKNILFLFVKVIRNLLYDVQRLNFKITFKNKVVFYCAGLNEHASLYNIYTLISFPKMFTYSQPIGKEGVIVPRFLPSFYSVLYIFHFLKFYYTSNNKIRSMIDYSRNDVMLTFGYYKYFSYIFQKSKPVAMVIANDHTFEMRILIHLCNKYKVKSFYVQHASVERRFPKLDMDFALLDGEVARDIYIGIGSDSTKISLIGMVKSDPWITQYNTSNTVKVVGYAINGMEDDKQLIEDIHKLVKAFPNIRFIVRPHPLHYTYQMKMRYNHLKSEFLKIKNLTLSDPRKEGSFLFLSNIDLLISGESGIHLEAALLNVYCVYYDNLNKFMDYYEFVKHGIAIRVNNADMLIDVMTPCLCKRPSIRKIAKKYVNTIGTEHEGKSALLAKNIIESHLSTL